MGIFCYADCGNPTRIWKAIKTETHPDREVTQKMESKLVGKWNEIMKDKQTPQEHE